MQQRQHNRESRRLLWLKVAVPTVASLFLFFYAVFFIHFPSIKANLLNHKREAVKSLVETAWSILEKQHALEKAGILTRAGAQKRVMAIIGAMRYGPENKDYFWINSMDGIILMYPYRSDLIGKNILGIKDVTGKEFVKDFIDVVRVQQSGYVEYMWQWKDDPARIVPKLSYVKGFEPWGWIVGSGIYLDDVKVEAEGQVRELALVMLFILGFIFILSMTSIWQGRKADLELRSSQKKLTAIFNQTYQFIALLSLDGDVLEVNQTSLNFIGKTEEEVQGKKFWETDWWSHSKENQERLREAVAAAAQGRMDRFEVTCLNLHGDVHSFDFSVKPIKSGEGRIDYLVAEGRDITSRIKTEEALRFSEENYRELVEYAQSIILRWTTEGTIIFANEFALKFLGYSEDELIGSSIVGTILPPEEAGEQALSAMIEGIGANQEEYLNIEMESLCKHGHAVWISWTNKPIIDQSGGYSGILSVGIDSTERKKVQDELTWLNEELEMRVDSRTMALEKSLESLKEAQKQLVESEKMASLGELVAGIAHEINTPLGIGVTTISYLDQKSQELEERYNAGQVKRSDFEKFIRICRESTMAISMNLERASELIQSFKQVAVDQTSEAKREFELKNYIQEVLLSLHSKYKNTGHTIEVLGPEVMLISYPGAIMQVLTNLLMNALKHAFEDIENGRIDIEIFPLEGGVRVVFADNGLGMNEMMKSRIFDPFFTTKRSHGGTGLGMHIVYNLITQKLGGTISCESEPGKGASFIIDLPHEAPE